MASVQLYRFQFLTNNPFGEFVAGDILDVYFETTSAVVPSYPLSFETTGITVNLNGSPYAGAGLILDFSPSIVSIQNFNPQICNGTSLLVFGLYGLNPYATYYTEADHYSCTVNAPTCNLMINGLPIVVPATDTATADGSIQIVASSNLDIQYNLGSDFVYGEGTDESFFSGLLPGQYRVFLRDEANCSANVLVDVPVDNTYGEIYRLEYTDNKSRETRIDILKRGYSGAISEVCGTGDPFEIQLRGEGSQNKFQALMSSQGNLGLLSETDLQFLELYTNDPNLYRLRYAKKFSESATTIVSLPALSTWLTESVDGSKPDWTTGATPNVTIPGNTSIIGGVITGVITSENLYVDYAFVPGNAYSLTLEFTRVVNSGTANPRSATLLITDTSFNTVFAISKGAVVGANTITLSFVADANCDRIVFNYTSGSNVTITVTSVSATTNGYQALWLGKILPQQYSEEYKAPPYYVSVVATDGLAELETVYLIQGDGHKYIGTVSLIKLVVTCLRSLKLNLNIRCACNLYAIDMDQTDSDDPFDQAYIDFETFYIGEKEPTMHFVLKSILEAFGARIVQWENRWNIVRVEEMSDDYDWREFDSEGNYTSNGTFSPVIDIEYPDDAGEDQDVVLANKDHNLEIKPGYGKIKAIYHLGLKSNLLANGDFRLKSVYIPSQNIYSFSLNKDGWTLVNAGYVITEDFEFIDENNIAYKISSGFDTLTGTWGGEAYLQSQLYGVKMGTNNQLKITVRCKVTRINITFGTSVYSIDVPYVKIRIRVRYGSLYLQADGSWTADENILVFYCETFNEYADYEITANQPTAGTPISGMDLDVRVYHGYAYHADFFDVADLKALETFDGVDSVLPTGYKTELRDGVSLPAQGYMYYYELDETTDAESVYQIIEPDDYHITNNPRKWVLRARKFIDPLPTTADTFFFAVDKVVVQYLTDNKEPINTIVRTAQGEANNPYILSPEFVIGSYSNLIVTDVSLGISLGVFFPSGGLSIVTVSTLSADLIYTGYLRDVNGVGYENFARDGFAEADKLHGIILKGYAAQYKKSWRLLRGSIYAHRYFGLLNTARLVNDGGRIYLPMGLSLRDKSCILSGELLEIKGAVAGDVGIETSAFSSGFKQSGFN